MSSKLSRTFPVETHLGLMYVIVRYEKRLPDAVFAYSKSSPEHKLNCFNAEVEAIGRLIHTALTTSRSKKRTLLQIIEELKDIQCEPHWVNGKQVKSPADGIAQALEVALREGPPKGVTDVQ